MLTGWSLASGQGSGGDDLQCGESHRTTLVCSKLRLICGSRVISLRNRLVEGSLVTSVGWIPTRHP